MVITYLDARDNKKLLVQRHVCRMHDAIKLCSDNNVRNDVNVIFYRNNA